ncbi:DUF6705 family protein [Flavobacterium panici]|uniref:DUF6705 domain-containing protein n=1 Tax=Flavobacterium panici TaxID=2654843 RepID=A0A9N8J823_9FLAO|nr:DUF6705 family protein [Flavobacterium panici]CAC9976799.1 hypothetical protein FLAPXU55_04527 [Flavobacterium panici]
MKTIIILSLMIVSLSCKAQQIVPLEKAIEYRDSDIEIPDGTYLKVVNGLLNKYLGIWKGTYNNKNYVFIITKTKKDFLEISKDKLLVRYLITTPTGSILEDTRNLPDTNPLVIEGDYISKSKGYYTLNYFGQNSKCGQSGVVFISTTKDNKQMKLSLSPNQGFINNKCSKIADQILPTTSMNLTKQ